MIKQSCLITYIQKNTFCYLHFNLFGGSAQIGDDIFDTHINTQPWKWFINKWKRPKIYSLHGVHRNTKHCLVIFSSLRTVLDYQSEYLGFICIFFLLLRQFTKARDFCLCKEKKKWKRLKRLFLLSTYAIDIWIVMGYDFDNQCQCDH